MSSTWRDRYADWLKFAVSLLVTIVLFLYQNSTILYYYPNMSHGVGVQNGIIIVGNAGFVPATNIQIEIDPDHKLRIQHLETYSRGRPVFNHTTQEQILYEVPQLHQGQTAEFRLSYEFNADSKFGESDILVQSTEKQGIALSGLFRLLEQVDKIFFAAEIITIYVGLWVFSTVLNNYRNKGKTRK